MIYYIFLFYVYLHSMLFNVFDLFSYMVVSNICFT